MDSNNHEAKHLNRSYTVVAVAYWEDLDFVIQVKYSIIDEYDSWMINKAHKANDDDEMIVWWRDYVRLTYSYVDLLKSISMEAR